MLTMASQGIVTSSDIVQGNSISARTLTFLINGAAPTIVSATYSVSADYGVVYTGACVVAGNVVTTPLIDGTITKCWPVRLLTWDVEVVLSTGEEKTYVKGTFNLLPTAQP